MQFTNLFKNKKTKQEDQQMASTLEQVRKAYEDLSEDDKRKFDQSKKDRIDESVGEQEHLEGNEDSQNAKDRVDESEGMKRADERKRDEDERHEDADEDRKEFDSLIAPIVERLNNIEAKLDARGKNPEAADKSESDKLAALERRFTN